MSVSPRWHNNEVIHSTSTNLRAWDGWSLGGHVDIQTNTWGILVPEISRAFRQPYEGSKDDEEYLANLFSLPRSTNL